MRIWPLLVFAVLSGIGCSGPYSSQKVSAKDAPTTSVRVERTTDQIIPEVVAATGELLAIDLATVSAKVPGRVTKILVDIGSQVEEGQILAELEKDDYEFRVKQSEALVEQTRAQLGIGTTKSDDVVAEKTSIARQAAASLKEAKLMFDNTTRLAKDGVMSRVDFERAQVAFQAAEARYQGSLEQVNQLQAQLSERRAQLSLARQQLADSVIRAPFRGAITKRQASLGEYLAINAPVVYLVRQHPLRLRLEVPERLAVRVQIGQSVDLKLEGNPIQRSGRVVRISPAIEAQNRSLTVEAEIPNADNLLRPGSFAEGVITVNPNAHGITVPRGALISFAGVERVFVVANGQLDERVIRSGRRLADRIEVLDGLKPGEDVVRDATDRMAKGQRVTVTKS